MKKSLAIGMILGSVLTAASIALMSPTNGVEIVQEIEVEEELLRLQNKKNNPK